VTAYAAEIKPTQTVWLDGIYISVFQVPGPASVRVDASRRVRSGVRALLAVCPGYTEHQGYNPLPKMGPTLLSIDAFFTLELFSHLKLFSIYMYCELDVHVEIPKETHIIIYWYQWPLSSENVVLFDCLIIKNVYNIITLYWNITTKISGILLKQKCCTNYIRKDTYEIKLLKKVFET